MAGLHQAKISQGWIHVTRGGHAYVLGPFTGDGVFTMLSSGIRVYASKDDAAKAPAQPVDQNQATAILGVLGSGPGIGQGFFGLGGDVSQAGNDITSPLSGLDEIGVVFKAVFTTLADWHLWASLGWLLAGLALVWTGLRLWLGKPIAAVPNPVTGTRQLISRTTGALRGGTSSSGPAVRDLPSIASGRGAKQAAGDAPLIPILLILAGAYLAWFGVRYWRDTQTVWPSDPVKALLQGHSLPAPSRSPSAQASLTSIEQATTTTGGGSGGGGGAPQGPLPSGTAQNTARLLLPKYGWDATQMAYLIPLWTRESGWSAQARNPSSGAFGVAQALGHGGAGTAAPDGTNEYGAQYGLTDAEARLANAGDLRWQIEWGLGYIKARYGSPQAAEAHEQQFGWY